MTVVAEPYWMERAGYDVYGTGSASTLHMTEPERRAAKRREQRRPTVGFALPPDPVEIRKPARPDRARSQGPVA